MLEADISVPVTYQREWQDGFGARGWKLDVSIGESSVIAATAEHGTRIPTSVLVHDILDHHLCGFGIGGHRNEAKALVQLASRTGADPRQDFRQIVDEDLLQGYCNGESLRSFLPEDLIGRIPEHILGDKDTIDFLCCDLGKQVLRDRLVSHFVTLGESVQDRVELRWLFMGLDYQRRREMGIALQHLLVQIDDLACEQEWERAHGRFIVGNRRCTAELDMPIRIQFTEQLDEHSEPFASDLTP